MLAVALAVGLGGREVAGNLIAGHYVRQLVKAGDTIQAAGHSGKVKELRSTSVVLEAAGGTVLVPNHAVLTSVAQSGGGR
jgi:small-conductance mechanosensitive channel